MKEKTILAIVMLFTMLSSCQKNDLEKPKSSETILMPKLEYVNQTLLKEYTDLEQLQEANTLRKMSKGSVVPLPIISVEKYNAMIDNYLVNERNNMRIDNWRKGPNGIQTVYTDGGKCYDATSGQEITCPAFQGGAGGSSVSCTGTFDSWNSTATIVFSANMSLTGSSIIESGVAFGGVTGTFKEAGPLGQTYYDKVVTYSQMYTETYTNNGISYTQVYRVYGNVNNGQTCTVHALRIQNTQ